MKTYRINALLFILLTLNVLNIRCGKTKDPVGSDNVNSDPQEQVILTISAEEANTLIEENKDNSAFVIIDVRTAGEYATGYIANAININFYDADFESNVNLLDKSGTYLIYCASGNRSGQALTVFEQLNFMSVYNLAGGIYTWINAGYPV